MNIPRPSLLLCALLATAALPAIAQIPNAETVRVQAPPPAPPVAPTPAHLTAVAQMLNALRMPLIIRQRILRAPGTSGEMRDVLLYIDAHISDAEIANIIAPAYAAYVSQQEAQQIATYSSSPAGRRHVEADLIQLKVINGTAQTQFSEQDNIEYQRIRALPGLHAVTSPGNPAYGKAITLLYGWSGKYYGGYRNQVFGPMMSTLMQAMKTNDAALLDHLAPAPTGLETLDKIAALCAPFYAQVGRDVIGLQHDMDQFRHEVKFSAEALSTPEGIADTRRVLNTADDSIERYMGHTTTLLQNFRSEANRLLPDQKARDDLDKTFSTVFDFMLRAGESARAVFDVMNRMLSFAESRQGKLQSQNGKLVFTDEADRQMFQQLANQLLVAAQGAQQISKEGQDMSERALKSVVPAK